MPKRLLPQTSATPSSYNWAHLGPTDYCVGASASPPAAGCPDKGTGRATALWVNPGNKNEILVGFADGGLWKTVNQGTSWTPLFDFQPTMSIGSVAAVVPSGSLDNTAVIYAATGEGNFGGGQVEGVGVIKSTDGGATWTVQSVPWVVAGDGTSMIPDRESIRRIVIDPANTQKVWIAADSGLFRTINGGTTWTLVSSAMYFKKLAGDCWNVYWTDVMIDDTTTPSTIYAANARISNAGCSTVGRQDNAVFRSTDDGVTWTNITTPNANCPGTVAGTTNRGYSCIGTGFAASGLTNSTTVNGTVGRITLARSTSNKKLIYALVGDYNTSANLGIWVTNDASVAASVTWRQVGNTTPAWASQSWYCLSGAVDPTNASRLIVGGLDAYVAAVPASGLATFNKTSDWTGVGATRYAHADHHQFVYADATTVYLATDGGLYVGTLAGTFGNANCFTWTGPNRGIDTLQFYAVAQHPTTLYQIHGGLQDNGEAQAVLTSGVITGWTEAANGDGGMSATSQANGNDTFEEYVYAIMAKSANGGSTYGTCFRNFGACTGIAGNGNCNGNCIPDNATEFIAPMELDANAQTVLFSGSRKVYRNSTAGSTTWVSYSPDLTTTNDGNDIVHIHSAKNNGVQGVVWAGTLNGKVWQTTGATSATAPTWTNKTVAPLPVRSVSWIDTDPANGNKALVTFTGFNTGHIFRTTDGGTNWTDISGALPNEPFNTIAVNPANTSQAFAGSDFAVYVNNDIWNGNTWTKVNNGQLPNVKVTEIGFSRAATGMMRAATHGRGFWESCTILTAAPTGVVATASSTTNSRVDIAWTTSGASSYNVYRSTTTGGPYTKIGNTTGTTFADTNGVQNVTYYYVVRGFDCAESVNSNEAFATAACDVVPGSPGTPTFSAPTGTCAIVVNWTAAAASTCSGGTITYNIYRAVGAFTPSAANRIASGISALTYTDNAALVSGTTYTYLVRAYDTVSKRESTNTTTAASAPAAGCTTSIGDLLVFSARSTSGANKLEFVGPSGGASLLLKICFSTSAYPTVPGTCTAVTPAFAVTANTKGSFTHSSLTNGTSYFYTAYVQNAAGTVFSKGVNLKATPLVTTGVVKWSFATTAAVLSPPGIGSVFTSGNDRVLHSINAGPSGGDWPSTWTPVLLNAASQARPPVPSIPGLGTGKQVYLGTQDGNVSCIDGNSGAQIWKTAAPIGAIVQAAANGMYTTYGGAFNLTLVGTRNSTADNVFYGLNALTGTTAWTFNNGGGANGIGVINGDASIDYATNRVYFTSRAKTGGTTSTAWCLSFNGTSATKLWSVPLGDIDGSATLYNGTVYIGNNAGTVYALNAANGTIKWSYATNDGPVKGFINPDWTGSNALYLSTTNNVWAIADNNTSASLIWKQAISAPSIPLFVGQLIVGSGDGRLYQLTNLAAASPTVTSVLLGGGGATVGSPSYDSDYNLIYVGTDAGAIYAVSLPIP